MNKINSSLLEREKIKSNVPTVANAKAGDGNTQSIKRMDFQVKKLSQLFDTYRKKTGYDFNNADSLTIIYYLTDTFGFHDFLIWSVTDTLKSKGTLALARKVHNGGGRLEPLKAGASAFKIRKTYNYHLNEPLLEVTIKSDTAYAYKSPVYSPVDGWSIIITAKRINGGYEISDYYLHEFEFVPLPYH